MITPLDIQNKEFKKTFRGFDTGEVNEFLDEVIEDYEKTYKENIELKDKVTVLTDQMKKYNTLEDTLKDTLVVAQTTADDMTASARDKAENIIEEAEIERKRIIERANDDVRNIEKEYSNLKKEMLIFKTQYKSFIEAQLTCLEDFYEQAEIIEENKVKNPVKLKRWKDTDELEAN
ncbi:MAG TPA: DivIVA domain-containing protein [Tissierellaceae bacterium]|nr:DivIVA domain-containing protein [Tissierellaceae bacterium]